jgi:hypothetical protein
MLFSPQTQLPLHPPRSEDESETEVYHFDSVDYTAIDLSEVVLELSKRSHLPASLMDSRLLDSLQVSCTL